MTYNWNKMVDITVPTGTNGWLYSGEVVINGIKVRFPVGTPTSVPEPAAVLLNKMIELEQEDAENTAKPDNHYVGSVTIPEGKILKLEKGAKLVDDSSAPTEVVILPETTVTVDEGQGYITTPLSATPTVGATAKIVYNGTEYTSPILLAENNTVMMAMGNTEALGLPGGNPDAPFVVALTPDGLDGAYGVAIPMDGATTITLSIVQTGGASEDNGASGVYTLVADATTLETAQKWSELAAAASAGRCVQMALRMATESGVVDVIYWPMARMTANGAVSALQFYNPGLILNNAGRYNVAAGDDDSIVITAISGD